MTKDTESASIVDVIIPTYRDDAWLAELLDCISRQDLSGVHVYVAHNMDEPSGLPTRQLAIPSLATVSAARGIGNARNAGAAAGTGKWLLFLDADGLLPDSFMSDLKALVQQEKPDAATFSYYADSFAPLMKLGTRLCWWYLWFFTKIGKGALPGFATLVRRSVFEQIGGYKDGLAISEDFVFSDDVLEAGFRISVYASPWLCYSVRRFDLPFFPALKMLWKYLVIDLKRRLRGRRYPYGDLVYEFGKHPAPGVRRRPHDITSARWILSKRR